MTDPITTSKSARENLARGLNALQADPTVPAQLVELAAPIAQAMGALHQLERTNQLAPHADIALNHVRGALAQLQAHPPNHPAVAQALEAVASSLSLVHSLSKMANGPAIGTAATVQAPPVQQQAPQAAPQPAAAAAVPTKTAAMPQKQPVAQAAPAPQPAPQPATPPPQQAYQAPAPQPQHSPSFPQASGPQGGMVARDPFAAPAPAGPPMGGPPMGGPPMGGPPMGGPPMGGPPPQGMGGMGQMHGAPAAGGAPQRASIPVPSPPMAGNLPVVNADLGAHSPTNFYKGLSGNDIIDHGGLFVSTYVIPKINTPIRLKVSLPGGYEFEANAVVKWSREDGGDAPPGFGAQFTAITPEARQLVYRYVRNREPLFHDDF
ncbi:MAG: PilZ domain-containing protein [Deltaproteobacteria bacterium]|nr:PilZ domain-containing protein [Deltaproteobacteria bacterium]